MQALFVNQVGEVMGKVMNQIRLSTEMDNHIINEADKIGIKKTEYVRFLIAKDIARKQERLDRLAHNGVSTSEKEML